MCSFALPLLLALVASDPVVQPATPPPTAPPATATSSEPAPAAAAPSTKERANKALRVAVYDLNVDGIEARVGRIVTDAVVSELRKLQRVSVVSMEEVRAMLDLEAQKQLTGCADDSCVSEIADSLGVDGVVIGSLARIGDEHVFGLRRIDQREARAIGQTSQRLTPANGEEWLAAIGPSIEQLFPEYPLRAGMERGVPAEIALRLNPPPLPPWAFWTTSATAGVLGAATAAAFALNGVLYAQLDARQKESLATVVPATEIKTLREQNDAAALVAVVLGASAGVVAASAGAMSLFTDWADHNSLHADANKAAHTTTVVDDGGAQ